MPGGATVKPMSRAAESGRPASRGMALRAARAHPCSACLLLGHGLASLSVACLARPTAATCCGPMSMPTTCCRRWCSSLLYVLVTALSFPAASVLTIFAGFLFGWLPGAVFAIIGATTGASLLFLAARTAFGGFLRTGQVALPRLVEGLREDAFAYLLVLRLAPSFPSSWSTSRRRCSTCGLKHLRRGDGDRHPARRARLFLAGAGLDSVLHGSQGGRPRRVDP